MASCTVDFFVRNSKGEVVRSKLFDDLRHHLSDRELAKEWYAVGTDPSFLGRVGSEATFDENGQITFKSLRKLTGGLDLSTEKELDLLNRDIHSGDYSYEDAMSKLQVFNRTSQYNDKYMALVQPSETTRGQYTLSVVRKNLTNQNALNDLISKKNLLERIKYHLNKAGVDYTFLEAGETGAGRYSVANATQTADGLYQLIRVANDEHIEGNLAEQAGHFAVNALQNTTLVSRLLAQMTPEVQKEVFDDPTRTDFDDNSALEAAGILVGRAIAGEIDKRTPFENLLKRITDFIKRVFAGVGPAANIERDVITANRIAEQIATGFMSPTFTGDVSDVVEGATKPSKKGPSLNVKVFRETLNRMKLQATEMKSYAGDLVDTFFGMAKQVESKVTAYNAGVNTDLMALEGIAESVSLMSDLLQQEIPGLLDSIDFNNVADFSMNMVRNAKALRTVRTFLVNAIDLANSIALVTADKEHTGKEILVGNTHAIESSDINGQRIMYDLDTMNANLLSAANQVKVVLDTKERDFFLEFCKDTLGSEYITRSARVLWGGKDGKKGLVHKDAGGKVFISDLLQSLSGDITLFERFLSSASNSSDLITQIVDKATKLGNKWADDLTTADQQELRHLQEELKGIFDKKYVGPEDMKAFCEIGRDGGLTGNFISQYNWGDYESDKADFKRECIAEFKQLHPDLGEFTDFQRSVLWDEFYRPKLKAWHRGDGTSPAHSQWSKEEERWIPSEEYHNAQYDSTIKGTELEGWLNKMMELKKKLDARLPEGSTNLYRMPQFKGTFLNKVRNKQLTDSTRQAFKSTVCQDIRATFCEDSEDRDYGSELTYNALEDDVFENELAFEREKVNRLPIFGINKLKDTSDISTDLFYSMFAYSGMVNSYAAMGQLVDTLEVGKEVLSRRKVGGIKTEKERTDPSRAFTRYQKFLDKQVYGINNKKVKVGNIVVNKIAGFFTGLASKLFLGGNIPGGIVNAGTGAIEVFKEAFAGEHFTMHDWRVAHQEYNKSLPYNIWSEVTGDATPDNKVALMIQHFNILGNEKDRQRDWHTDTVSRFRRGWIGYTGDNVFLPYKAGEHYMQSIAYLGLASSIKVYDKKGNPISLLNAYKRANLGDGVFALKLAANEDRYNDLASTQNLLNKAIQSGDPTYLTAHIKPEQRRILTSIDPDYQNASLLTLSTAVDKMMDEESRFYKSRGAKDQWHLIKSIFDKLSAPSTSPFGPTINLTTEEQAYIDSHGYNLANTANTLASLQGDMNNLVWTVDDESSFMDKAREINNRMHGIYNNQDKVALQQSIFGNMLLAMRGYALGLMERRYSQSKYSVALGGESEGSMSTLGKVIASTFTDRQGFKTTFMALAMPVFMGEKTKQMMIQAGFSTNQFYNMRRTFCDFAFIAMLSVIKMLTAKKKGADDDDDDTLEGLAYYFSNRLFREQAAYNLPGVGLDEVQSITSLVPTGVSVLTDIWDLFYLAAGSQMVSDVEDSRFYYQQNKPGVYEKYEPKWERKFKKMIPWYRSTFVFSHPYEAAASFEYGRRLKTK